MPNERIVITGFSNATPEGLTLELSAKGSLKGHGLKSKEFWVSWDKIGSALFDDYCTDLDETKSIRERS